MCLMKVTSTRISLVKSLIKRVAYSGRKVQNDLKYLLYNITIKIIVTNEIRLDSSCLR